MIAMIAKNRDLVRMISLTVFFRMALFPCTVPFFFNPFTSFACQTPFLKTENRQLTSESKTNALFYSYHSISSIGLGDGFTTLLTTLPLFIRITRFAIGVIAELCVISTTVMPSSLHFVCKSFRILLPVL